MNELDIADKILGLLIGGHDTASVACTFIVKYLAEFPHIYDRVYQGESTNFLAGFQFSLSKFVFSKDDQNQVLYFKYLHYIL